MTAYRLDIIDIGCARGDRLLFDSINEQLKPGELLHVAGSNGSGKTTLLRTLCGLSRPAAGEIRWRDIPIQKLGDDYRADLAYLGHKDSVQGELTPAENLRTLACASVDRTADRIDEALDRLGVAAYRSFPTKLLSQGQKRRAALARLLVQAKPLWILDEPFTALDAASCRLLGDILSAHLAGGGIAVLASHQPFDIAAVAVKRIDLDAARSAKPPTPGVRSPRPAVSAQHSA